MTSRYDLMTMRKDRDGKARYTRVGTMFPTKSGDGFALKFDALPLANAEGELWVSAYPPKDREDGGQPRQAGKPTFPVRSSHAVIDDEIPF